MQAADRRPRSLNGKVFGVGLARTGTTSLHHAMSILGIDSAPNSVALLDRIDRNFLARHDAFFDNPVPFRYRALAEICADAKWIVTQRPLETWLDSMRWLFGPGLDRLDRRTRSLGDRVHRAVYGTDVFDATVLTDVYTGHYHDLAAWVATRPHVWLHVDRGLDWEPICGLLGAPVPAVPFPHVNRRTSGAD